MMKAHRIVGGSHRPPPDQGHRPGSNSAVPPDRAEPPNPLRRELRLRPRFRAREPPGPATARAASQAQVHRKTGEAQPGPALWIAAPERAGRGQNRRSTRRPPLPEEAASALSIGFPRRAEEIGLPCGGLLRIAAEGWHGPRARAKAGHDRQERKEDRKSTRLNSSHKCATRMPSSG